MKKKSSSQLKLFRAPKSARRGIYCPGDLQTLLAKLNALPQVDSLLVLQVAAATFCDDVEAGRLRICASCDRFFFASRIEARGCSETCNARLRKRKQRAKQ